MQEDTFRFDLDTLSYTRLNILYQFNMALIQCCLYGFQLGIVCMDTNWRTTQYIV